MKYEKLKRKIEKIMLIHFCEHKPKCYSKENTFEMSYVEFWKRMDRVITLLKKQKGDELSK